MQILRKIAIILFTLYGIFCLGLYLGQDKILFLPDVLPKDHQYRIGEEVDIEVEEGVHLNCVKIPAKNPQGVVLYLHGNKGSNRRCLRQASMLTGNGYDVFMPDYRGYGKSDGHIESEDQLYQDCQKVYDYLAAKYGEDKIVITGYSLGTGIASYLAANNQPWRLILNSPFQSICDLKDRKLPIIPDFLVKYPLSNQSHLQHIKAPVTIFHGTDDQLIPFDSAKNLKRLQPEMIELVPLQGTSHRRAIFHDLYRKRVAEILRIGT